MPEKKGTTNKINDSLVETLVQTNIALDKKNLELMESMHVLVKKIDALVGIFEEASKHVLEVGEDKRVLDMTDKVEALIKQNEIIAKGLLLLEQYVRSKNQFEKSM